MSKLLMSTALAASLLAAPAIAQEAPVTLAEHGLQARIDALAGTPDGAFEMGLLQTLRGVERALQTGYRHGLDTGQLDFPVLRLMEGGNPAPEPAGPELMGESLSAFLADMDQARAHLDRVPEGAEPEALITLQDIWFDINGDGIRAPFEGAMELLAPEVLDWRGMQAVRDGNLLDTPLTIRFDGADVAWLRAYTHMLSGLAEALLAFDPTPSLVALAVYDRQMQAAPVKPISGDQDELAARLEQLTTERDALNSRIEAVNTETNAIWSRIRELEAQGDAGDSLAAEKDRAASLQVEQNRMWNDRRALDARIDATRALMVPEAPSIGDQFGRELDLVYIVIDTLRRQPDVAHAQAVRDHWRRMIAQNKLFWAALDDETDNDREWIPNARQTSALPLSVPPEIRETWLAVLDDAEAVLEGELLIPHPLLPAGYGIDLAAWFNAPSPLNILDWLHGIGAVDYTARGPRISNGNWRALERLTSGNAGAFALFLN
ncbi:hypothetical protein [Mesobacterium pallidum]|uniref:hypothetical protein n=1 Tax=Mesobacterium pallidum TaxID=2872037 RepID=UPI001EE1E5AE|nr:hypothetical protein [Mesobacterium pallidum]